MDSDQGKLFIGGISWETTEEKLKEHFENYGEVAHTVVMRDKDTQRPRGFGFVTFAVPSVLDRVLQDTHNIDGRTVEAKRAMPREEQQVTRSSNPNPSRGYGSGGSGAVKTKKIFVGGLPATLTEEMFRDYFETYGHVTDVVVMYDQNTQRPRGFGFISFDSEDAVDRVLHKTFHDLNGKQVEVKRALPKDANMSGSGHSMGGSAGDGGGYQGYGSSGGSQNAYGGRMDSNRYMQPQSASGGFPPYGSAGFNATGYGYGPAGNGMGFGAYGAYGGPAAAYGTPGVPSPGYGGGPVGAPRNSWGAQGVSGYGAVGYSNVSSWGAPSPGNPPGSVGPGTAPTGQSPNGTSGYGSQGYGYGGYGGGDVSYPGAGGYGAVGGHNGSVPSNNAGGSEMQGGGGYGYNDSGYGNAGWRLDPSQAPRPQGSYGSGYVGAPSRQPQQQ